MIMKALALSFRKRHYVAISDHLRSVNACNLELNWTEFFDLWLWIAYDLLWIIIYDIPTGKLSDPQSFLPKWPAYSLFASSSTYTKIVWKFLIKATQTTLMFWTIIPVWSADHGLDGNRLFSPIPWYYLAFPIVPWYIFVRCDQYIW